MYLNMALIVPDHGRREFTTMNAIEEIDGLRIVFVVGSGLDDEARDLFPNAINAGITSPREFFT